MITILSYGYLNAREGNLEEYYLLLLTGTLGSSILVASNHFITLFLGLEVLSVSLYTLIAYLRTGEQGIEAGLKYLILAAASSAFLLFGMALLYAQIGTMQFDHLATRLP
ncbi:MAG: NADH-quinone oxidoreductase subunit N, partial [Aliifodinibius sp.]|nr:NADH-quinone oxidoreductase subunit N [Fodinibius sp.]NIY25347.1 NADH-quinone oxidoreductase subunit N [Fodinibius sp.]